MFWALPISPRAGASPRSAPQRIAPRRSAHPSPARAINRAPQPGTALRGQDRETAATRCCAALRSAMPRHATLRSAHPSFALHDQKGTTTWHKPSCSRPGNQRHAFQRYAAPRDAMHRHALPSLVSSTNKNPPHPGQAFVLKPGKPALCTAPHCLAAPRIALRRLASLRAAHPSLSVNDQDRPQLDQPFAVKVGNRRSATHLDASHRVAAHRFAPRLSAALRSPIAPDPRIKDRTQHQQPFAVKLVKTPRRCAPQRFAMRRSAHPSFRRFTIKTGTSPLSE